MAKHKSISSKGGNIKTQLRLLPGYIILTLWILFTAVLLGWILAASLSTSREIYTGTVLQFESGFHFENYAAAWNVSIHVE